MKKTNSPVPQKLLIVLCFLSALGFAGFTYKSYSSYQLTQKNLNEKRDKLAAVKKEIIEITTDIKNYEKEKKEFSELLFEERDVPAFLDGFSESAKKALVNIVGMQTQGFSEVEIPAGLRSSRDKSARERLGREEQTYDRQQELENVLTLAAMPIQINLEGTFESIVNFLISLEGYKQLLTVSNFEIATTREYPSLDCGFTLKIYSLKSLGELQR